MEKFQEISNESHRYFINEARKEAEKGTHPFTKVGCVMVLNGKIIARGHNHFLTSKNAVEFQDQNNFLITDKDYRDYQFIHAEKDALNNLNLDFEFLIRRVEIMKNREEILKEYHEEISQLKLKNEGKKIEKDIEDMFLLHKQYEGIIVYVTHCCCSYCFRELLELGIKFFVFEEENTDGCFITKEQQKSNECMKNLSGAQIIYIK